jgi:molecular chaperone HscA
MVALGIDLGTTYSLVAIAEGREGRPRILADEHGEGRVPSAVFFGATQAHGAIVGFAAFAAARTGDGALLTSTKRFMGQGRAAALAHRDADRAQHFSLWEGPGVDPRQVQLTVPDGEGGLRATTPIEVAAYVLKTLKDRAEAVLGHEVTDAVITVPAYFDDAQRQATRDAGRLAGLKVLRLLAEPTAAAVAYGLDTEAEGRGQGTYAVFDLGGGTFDISILTFDRGLFRVLSTSGDTALGGDDLDWPIARRILDAAGLAATATPRQTQQALMMARAAKEALTDRDVVDIEGVIDGVGAGRGAVAFSLSRADFETLALPVVNRCAGPCERALLDAGLTPAALDGVILVGGSTRVPLVRRFVREFFGREPLLDAHPDEVVAAGAARQAGLLSGTSDTDMLLLDVTPLSLGIETMGGVVDKLIPRNASIPCSATHTFTTYADGQTAMDIHVVQGEREKVEHCKSLARFRLRGIPALGAGLARVQVTFQLDADGLLTVTAKEQATGLSQTVEVKPSYGLTDHEVEEMLLASIDNAEADITERLVIEKRVEARRVLQSTQKAIDEDGALLLEGERDAVSAAMRALVDSIAGDDRHAIQAATEALDAVTTPFAQRRMTKRIGDALENKRIDDI